MTTPNLGLTKPTVGGSTNTWGTTLNAVIDAIDAAFDAATGHDHDGTAGGGPKLKPAGLDTLGTDGLVAADADGVFYPRVLTGGNGIGIEDGGGVAGNPTFALDIDGMTAETAGADDDLVPVGDTSEAGAPRKMTKANFLKGAKIISPTLAFNAEGSVPGPTKTLDTSLYQWFAATSTGNTTWTFGSPPASGLGFGFILELTNGGAFSQTWPASVDWPNGVAPTLSASGVDVLVFITRDGGTTWRGVLSMGDSR